MVYTIDGYHGTIKPYADSILFSQRFRRSKKINEWLGYGIYFYGHCEEAIWWAKIQADRHGSSPAVLLAKIECDNTEYLDLDVFDNVFDVNNCFKRFLRSLKKENTVGIDFESAGIDERRCFAIELYKETHPDIKLISYTFDVPTRNPRAYASLAFVPRQKQYCVVSSDIIKSINNVDGIA